MVLPDLTLQPIVTRSRTEWESIDDIEIMNGEIIEEMPTLLHGFITQVLSWYIGSYLRQQPLGYVIPEGRYQLPGDQQNALIPDLSYISKQTGGIVRHGAAPFMPDLAIEVQSEDQSDQFMLNKGRLYLEKGVKLVWLVYSYKNIVEVLTPTQRQLLTVNDDLDGGDVLPGLRIPIAELFPPED